MSTRCSEDVEYILLRTISEHEEPVGAGFLADTLQKERDFKISEATIGRYLRNFEQQGFLQSEKYDGRFRGRTITDSGKEHIRVLAVGRCQTKAVEDVIEMLHNGGDQQLRYALVTRQIVEPEIAALAAHNATQEDLAAIRKVVDEMAQLTGTGKSMAATDAPFHIAIAKASGNPILESVLRMIRTNRDYSPEIEYIINTSAQNNPSDHLSIFRAIEARDPDKARQIMKQHIQNIITKIDTYEKGEC